jgi:hypothetical protein
MIKILIMAAGFLLLQSCSNNGGESGAVDDGIKAIDSNGGLADTPYNQSTSVTDTARLENRVDLSKRDTFDKK